VTPGDRGPARTAILAQRGARKLHGQEQTRVHPEAALGAEPRRLGQTPATYLQGFFGVVFAPEIRAVLVIILMGGGVDGKHFFVLRVEGSAKVYVLGMVGCPGSCGVVALLDCRGGGLLRFSVFCRWGRVKQILPSTPHP
jgi:hypothetical protein